MNTGLRAVSATGVTLRLIRAATVASLLLAVAPGMGWGAIVQQARLVPSDPEENLYFGNTTFAGNPIAISGDTVVVASTQSYSAQDGVGAVYVYVRPAGGWSSMVQTAKLTNPEPETSETFGYSVAIDGDTVVVGTGGSAVYVFVRPVGGWVDTAVGVRLAPSSAPVTGFGTSVAIRGDTIAVGGAFLGTPAHSGSVYVFVKPGGGWAAATETAELQNSAATLNDRLGASVATDGNTVVAGAPAPFQYSTPGKALVFQRPITGWTTMTETAVLTSSDGANGDVFGLAAAVDGNTIVVGAPEHDSMTTLSVGRGYVYEKPLLGWATGTETVAFGPSTSTEATSFGWTVGASGSQVAIGARSESFARGRVYLFDRPSGGWAPTAPTAIVRASDETPDDQFGTGTALDAGTMAITAPGDDLPHRYFDGAAYVFEDVPGAILCPSSATSGCLAGAQGSLDLKYDAGKETTNKVAWKFGKGPELHRADFGDPTSTTHYALCVYDDGALAFSARIAPSALRWLLAGTDGWKYKDGNKIALIDGIKAAKLAGGLAGRSKITIGGKGQDLAQTPDIGNVKALNATISVVAQLLQTGGSCYETSFSPAQVRKNSVVDNAKIVFQAKY